MEFIEERRTRKRLKKLPPLHEREIKQKRVGKTTGNSYQFTRTGYRPDIDVVTRSAWEANIIRVLDIHGVKWEFEPRLFTFPIKRGTRAYLPDLYLPKTDEYVEIKGWMDEKSRIKLKRFKKYYPKEFGSMHIIIGKSSKASLKICQDLEMPSILFYEDFQAEYKAKLPNHWE